MKRIEIAFLVLFLAVISFTSCKKDRLNLDPNFEIGFSTDTLIFDTVFTTVGSITQSFKIYNTSKEDVKLDRIYLSGKKITGTSVFRLNINGNPSNDVVDYILASGDSMYVFAEATINPNMVDAPLIHTDSVVFAFNGKERNVKLVAWGQDAIFLNSEEITCNEIWNSNKPYVIYNSALVQKGCKLTINEGVKVYFNKNSTLFVAGTLEVNGTFAQKVTFRGDRLDKPYSEFSGSWNGIHFLAGSANNTMNWAEVRNGVIGVRCDSLPASGAKNVELNNCLISNMVFVGILGFSASIDVNNCLVYECGKYTFAGDLGGNYRFNYTTFANYGIGFGRSEPSFLLANTDFVDVNSNTVNTTLNAAMNNCIVYGSKEEEFIFSDDGKLPFQFTGKNNLYRSNTALYVTKGYVNIADNKRNEDPKFKDSNKFNYRIDTLSPAYKYAKSDPKFNLDLDNKLRDSNTPTVGAFERKE